MERFLYLLLQPLKDFWAGFVAFIPNLMAMFLIVVIGLMTAWLVNLLLMRVFKAIDFDAWCDRVGLTAIIRKGDIWSSLLHIGTAMNERE